jgi:hypothetical protein
VIYDSIFVSEKNKLSDKAIQTHIALSRSIPHEPVGFFNIQKKEIESK